VICPELTLFRMYSMISKKTIGEVIVPKLVTFDKVAA
jgi:hypothetical protein